MIWSKVFSLLVNTELVGGGASAPVAEAAQAAGAAEAAPGSLAGLFGGNGMFVLVIYAAVIGGMWFLMARPQRKREKALRDMQEAIKVGDDVLTSSGLYGHVVSIGEDCFVVEFGSGKGVRIPVRKTDIIGNKAPSMNA